MFTPTQEISNKHIFYRFNDLDLPVYIFHFP